MVTKRELDKIRRKYEKKFDALDKKHEAERIRLYAQKGRELTKAVKKRR